MKAGERPPKRRREACGHRGWWALTLTLALVSMGAGAQPAELPLTVSPRVLSWKFSVDDDAQGGWLAGEWAKGRIRMPFFSGGAGTTANDLNLVLFATLLGTGAPVTPGPNFSMPKGQSPEGAASLSYAVLRQDASVLSLQIDAEGCGAYCEEWKRWFTFDLRAGRLLTLDQLLTPKGRVAALASLNRERRARYQRALQDVAAQRRAKGQKADVVEGLADMAADCLARVPKASPSESDAAGWAPSAAFSLRREGVLALWAERCSNHASRAGDVVGDVALLLPWAIWSPWLTPQAEAWLQGQGEAVSVKEPTGRMWHGTVGGSAVSLWLGPDLGEGLAGWYAYDKYRQPLKLQGRREGQRLTLKEGQAREDEPAPTLTLSLRDGGLQGEWRGAGKVLPVSLR